MAQAELKSPDAEPATIDADIAAYEVAVVDSSRDFAVSANGSSSVYPATFRPAVLVVLVIG